MNYQSISGSLAVLIKRSAAAGGTGKWVAGGSQHSRGKAHSAAMWVVSKGAAMLAVSVAPSSCRLSLRAAQEHVLIDQVGACVSS